MKKLEEIQNRKTMSAYGGVGSIIETKDNGSLLVDYYNKWGCYGTNGLGRVILNDDRLLQYLRYNKGMRSLAELREIPTPDDINKYSTKKGDLRDTIKSSYFPGWFYCRNKNCHRLFRYDDWRTIWEERKEWEYTNKRGGKKTFKDGKFRDNYPACPYCNRALGENRVSRSKKLEQIRFCMASLDSGEIEDIPFGQLINVQPTDNYYEVKTDTTVEPDLEYRTSADSDGLQSNYVQKIGDNSRRLSMAQIASKYIIYNGAAYKLVLRNQNNVYYPDVVRAIYIPQDIHQDRSLLDKIWDYRNRNNNAKQISDSLAQENPPVEISPEEVQAIIDSQDLDVQEYAYFTNADNYYNGRNCKDDFYAVRFENLCHRFVKRFYAIHRLREDSTIPGFWRISNNEQTWLNVGKRQEKQMQPKYHSTYANAAGTPPTFIPVAKAFGEGFFLDIDTAQLPDSDEAYTFVHTFSHLVMKELEFECGYSIQSIKEKIYKKQDNSAFGILIYTVGSSEGSYGGLVSLLPNDVNAESARLLKIIDNALERAKDCPNDPICSAEGGHCFACVDIPEISCCDWNKNINRNSVNKINAQSGGDAVEQQSEKPNVDTAAETPNGDTAAETSLEGAVEPVGGRIVLS